jgi:(E)-4-hydroxy-3-methylbut-2-enyl-diphosphate synthase
VGVNSGSVGGRGLTRAHQNLADKMVKSTLDYVKILEGFKFYNTVISIKGSDIFDTIAAYRKISKLCDYPLHLGVTATGTPEAGRVKSAIALGVLLLEGIGDTIRVSLTAEPREEIGSAKYILESLGLRNFGPQIISCPTCGRCNVDLVKMVRDLESKLSTIDHRIWTKPPKVALMGCEVNGPGEAKEADLGIAFGKKDGVLFKNGKSIRKIPFISCADTLLKEIGDGYNQKVKARA